MIKCQHGFLCPHDGVWIITKPSLRGEAVKMRICEYHIHYYKDHPREKAQ